MSHAVIQRDEMLTAQLDLGGAPIDLAEYATTGLLAVAAELSRRSWSAFNGDNMGIITNQERNDPAQMIEAYRTPMM